MRKLLFLPLVALLAACGGDEDCKHEIESKRGVSMCMPESESMGLCVIEPTHACLDSCGGATVVALFAPGEGGPVMTVCSCTDDEALLNACNAEWPLSRFPV